MVKTNYSDLNLVVVQALNNRNIGTAMKPQKCDVLIFVFHLRNFLNLTQNTFPRMDLFK